MTDEMPKSMSEMVRRHGEMPKHVAVETLRDHAAHFDPPRRSLDGLTSVLLHVAADEIERLSWEVRPRAPHRGFVIVAPVHCPDGFPSSFALTADEAWGRVFGVADPGPFRRDAERKGWRAVPARVVLDPEDPGPEGGG